MASKLLTYKFNADTQTAEKKIERLEQSFKGLQVALAKDVRQLTKFANQSTKANNAMAKTSRATARYTKGINLSTNSIVRHIRRLESLAVGIYAVQQAYKSTLGVGIDFNRQMEDSSIAISAIIASTSKNQTTSGRGVDEAEKWKMAKKEADNYIQSLVKLNSMTPTNLEDTTKIFQILLPQMRKHKAKSQEMLRLTKLLSIATVTGNVSMLESKQALDGLLNGTTKASSELMVYLGTLGITNEKIKEMGKQGKVVEYLLEVLGRLEPAGKMIQESWKGIATVLGNEWKTLMGAATEPLFEDIKQGLTDLTAYIKVNRDQWILDIRVFMLDLKDMGASLGAIWDYVIQRVTEANNFLEYMGVSVGTLRDAFIYLKDALVENKEVIGDIVIALGIWKVGSWLYTGLRGVISLIGRMTFITWGLDTAMKATGASSRWAMVGGAFGKGIKWIMGLLGASGLVGSIKNVGTALRMNQATLGTWRGAWATAVGSISTMLTSLKSQIATLMGALGGLVSAAAAAGAAASAGIASAANSAMQKAKIQGGKVYGLNKSELEAKMNFLTGLQNKGETGRFGTESALQKILDRTANYYSKINTEATKATGAVVKFQKLNFNKPAVGEFTGVGNIAKAQAILKAENTELEKKLADSLVPRDAPKPGNKPTKTEIDATKRLSEQKLKWEENLNNTLYKNTHTRSEYDRKKINEKWDLALKRGLDAHKVEMNRQIELGNLDAKIYDAKMKQQKKGATGWDKATQARANKGISSSGGASGQKALSDYRDNLKQTRIAQIESWGNAVKEMGTFFKNTQLEAAGTLINQLGKIFVNGKGSFNGSSMGGTIDKLLGADTYASSGASLGGSIGGAIGGLFGNSASGKFLGELGGMIIGGLFGKTKKTGEGFTVKSSINSLNELDENVKTYESFKKKSWLRTKRWDKTKDLTTQSIIQLEGIYNSFDALMSRMGDFQLGSINAGQYDTIGGGFAEAFFEGLVAENIQATQRGLFNIFSGNDLFTDIQRMTLVASWEEYAKEVKKDVDEVVFEAFTKFENVRTEFKNLADTSKYKLPSLQSKLDEANQAVLRYAIEGVTKENFLERSQQAKTNNTLTKREITKWTNLGIALNTASKATTAYEKALESQNKVTYNSMKEINGLWIGKYSPFNMLQKTQYANNIADLAVNNTNYNEVDTAQKALDTAYKSATTNEGYIREFMRLNTALEKEVDNATNKDLLDELIRLRKEVEELKEINSDSNTIALQRTA